MAWLGPHTLELVPTPLYTGTIIGTLIEQILLFSVFLTSNNQKYWVTCTDAHCRGIKLRKRAAYILCNSTYVTYMDNTVNEIWIIVVTNKLKLCSSRLYHTLTISFICVMNTFVMSQIIWFDLPYLLDLCRTLELSRTAVLFEGFYPCFWK